MNETIRKNKAPKLDNKRRPSSRPTGARIAVGILKFLFVLLVVLLMIALTLFFSLKIICGNTSQSAKETFVTTFLETGQLKFVPSLFLSKEEIAEIVEKNSMKKIEEDVNTSLITINKSDSPGEKTEEPIEITEIAGRTFSATMMKIKDPSRVWVATLDQWQERGVTLDVLVKNSGSLAGMNGGLYNSYNNSGGAPYGVVVTKGAITFNRPEDFTGLYLIGFTEDNILQIIDIDGKTASDVEEIVQTNRIRDAVTFQEDASDRNNHFVQLIINGNPRELNGAGSGLNPRTAIGQCADGSVLMLVTDGRAIKGHLGASASDLIDIMMEYGAVNAANLDGGSSSCMYYDNDWLMKSVTFAYASSSWNLPLAFVVKP